VDKLTTWNESIDENFQLFDNLETSCCKQMLKNIDSTPVFVTPVERERFAYACLQCLFELCSDEKDAKVTVPILLKRCAFVIHNYTVDQPLFGRCSLLRHLCFIQDLLKKHILSGQNAHLFYLQHVISEAICLKDSNIDKLLKECLKKIGEDLGVYKINIKHI
ncbi:10050_t:CDS:2, partial [Racocetra fulgida]